MPTDARAADSTRPYRLFAPAGLVGSPTQGLVFGVYPGGPTGEAIDAPSPDRRVVIQRLGQLAGGRPLLVHLYTGWVWYDPVALESEIADYAKAGYGVVLSVRFVPPSGHETDVDGYEAFVRAVARRHAQQSGLVSLVVGNEANLSGSADASDGAFAAARQAVVRGVVAARQEIERLGSHTQVGFNFAWTGDTDSDAAFVQDLAQRGGLPFVGSVQFIGISLYPGTWGPGTGRPYEDAVDALRSSRASVSAVREFASLPLDLLEVGAPLVDERDQAARLDAFVRAALDWQQRLNLGQFLWFDLCDSDSRSATAAAHYGLLHTDLTLKPSFAVYRDLIQAPRRSGASSQAT
jgi:hypothetical protein